MARASILVEHVILCNMDHIANWPRVLNSLKFTHFLLVEETGVPGENHRPAACPRQTLSHNVVSSAPRDERDSNLQLMLIAQVVLNPSIIRT